MGSLAPAAHKLRIQVSDAAGKPVSGILAELIVANPERAARGAVNEAATVIRTLHTNGGGYAIFSLESIPEPIKSAGNVALRFDGRADLNYALAPASLSGGSRLEKYTLPSAWTAPEALAAPQAWVDGTIDADDVWIIPSIFPELGDLEFGTNYCGRLVPKDLTVRVFNRDQVTRTALNVVNGVAPNTDDCALVRQGNNDTPAGQVGTGSRTFPLHEGKLLRYEIKWTRLGYTFGDLLYSLALAPCESATLAVSHWIHRQRARAEQSSDSAQAQSASYADQGHVSDAMSALSSGSQNTKAQGLTLGGTTGGSASGVVDGWLIKGTSAFGVGYASTKTNSSNTSQFVSNATHAFADSIQQQAEGWRRDHQIVIMEQTETQNQNISYRTVCNNNHCHVLNVFYHEVLNNFRVASRYLGSREVFFVPYEIRSFDAELALCAKPCLLPFLLDKELASCYDETKWSAAQAAATSPNSTSPPPTPSNPALVTQFKVELKFLETPQEGFTSGFEFIIGPKTGGQSQIFPIVRSDIWFPGYTYTYVISTPGVDMADIDRIVLKNATSNPQETLMIEHFAISAKDPVSGQWVPIGSGQTVRLNWLQGATVAPIYEPPPITTTPTTPQTQPTQPVAESVPTGCLARLLRHLNCNKVYYNSLLWLLEDPNERICRFDRITVGNDETFLTDLIDPEPVAVMGNCVAFLKADSPFTPWTGDPIVDERLVTIPTPGIFADAALGKCTTCEKVDPDRYWDWKDTPCNCAGKDVTLATPTPSSLFPASGPFLAYPTSLVGSAAPTGTLGGATNSLVSSFGGALATAMLAGKDSAAELEQLAKMIASMTAMLEKVAPDPGSGPTPSPGSAPAKSG